MAGRLFHLPQELRSSVYEHVFSGRRDIRVSTDHLETGLLQASRRTRNEVIQYMRDRLIFVFQGPDDFAKLKRGQIAQGGRSGVQKIVPYSRPYISSVKIVMNFNIWRENFWHPFGGNPLLCLPPRHEVASIDARDITFFIGDDILPWQYYIGTRFHEQYRLMVNVLVHRANDHDVEINSRLIFMRRNWDWIFSTWQQCGLQDVKQVHLALHNFEFWVGHTHIHDVSFEWRPVVDFLRLLMLAPPSIPTLKVDGLGSEFLRSVLYNLQIAVPPDYVDDSIIPEVAIRMEELYKMGKLGIKHSTTPWLERLRKRNTPQFPGTEGQNDEGLY